MSIIKKTDISSASAVQVWPGRNIEFLGLDPESGVHYMTCVRDGVQFGHVVDLDERSFVKNGFLKIASYDYFEALYGIPQEKGPPKIDWTRVADHFHEQSNEAGFFDVTSRRGRGCWADKTKSGNSIYVYSTGTHIVVDGDVDTAQPISQKLDLQASYVPVAGVSGFPSGDDLSEDDLQFLRHAVSSFRMSKEHQFLYLGFLAATTIAGALPWRPHAWLTAPRGSGKSTIARFHEALLSTTGLEGFSAPTTPAGIRQKMKFDSVPIFYDEFEPDGERMRNIIDGCMTMFRSAASTDAPMIAQGTKTGSGASYAIRSSVFVQSVATYFPMDTDKSRFIILSLDPAGKKKAEEIEKWELSQAEIKERAKEMSLRFLGHILRRVRIVIAAMLRFKSVIAEMSDSRNGDLYGSIAAAHYVLFSNTNRAPKLDEARAYLIAEGFVQPEAEKVPDHEKVLDILFAQPLDVQTLIDGRLQTERTTIGTAIQTVIVTEETKENIDFRADLLEGLNQKGIRLMSSFAHEGYENVSIARIFGRSHLDSIKFHIAVAIQHPYLNKVFKGTKYGECYQWLMRIEGAVKLPSNMRFLGFSSPKQVICIPLKSENYQSNQSDVFV